MIGIYIYIYIFSLHMVFCNTVIRDSCIPVLRGFLGRDQLIQTSAAGSEATLLGVGCPFESEISSLARDRISSWDLKALPFPWSRGVHRLRRLGRLAHRRQSVQRAQGWAPSSNKQKPLSAQQLSCVLLFCGLLPLGIRYPKIL